MTKKPTFFISSTIYDFADLRSAVKYNLEKVGCRVLASETNDFGNDLDTHSYEACLKQIDQADYFLLFIGSRVGGWQDKENKISITRAEYRYAYERHKKGKLKIITFVRQSVWDVREDRKALQAQIQKMALKKEEKDKLSKLSSKFLCDPEHIIEFIKEVGRNEDTKEAMKTEGEMPTGNWIYTFNNYSEIQEVLSTSIFQGQTHEKTIQFKNLRKNLLEILVKLHMKNNGDVLDVDKAALRFMKKNPVTKDFTKSIFLSNDDFSTLTFLSLSLGRPKIDVSLLSRISESRLFDSFDIHTGTYSDSMASKDLFQLLELCRFLSGERESFLTQILGKNPSKAGSGSLPISPVKLLLMYGEVIKRENIKRICLALIKHIDGKVYSSPKLLPSSPIASFNTELSKEKVTPEDIANHYNL